MLEERRERYINPYMPPQSSTSKPRKAHGTTAFRMFIP